MTPTEKHRETARSVLGDWMVGEHPQLVGIFASALANAEREGMKRAAEIAKGYGNFDVDTDYGAGYKQAVLNVRAAILSEADEA